MSTDLLQASAVKKFTDSDQAAALIADGDLGVDVGGDSEGLVWVFQGSDDDRPWRDPEGTGKAAVVLTFNDSWGANQHNTSDMPVLTALVYSDTSRSADGTPTTRDGKARALRVIQALKEVFHDAANKDHEWPLDLRIHSCVATNGATIYPVPDTDGMHRASIRFQILM